ncbi:UDP-glucose:undecaprenyl-phosphate glucose-1-phosphate transferase [Flavobacteriaceae bacterium UJ101]|nr:UDP-glucose:undecaprenyl-phosphate glucose-1-phosphate transferase [Flavobacteriaceae bacterium UJ101]
MKKTRYSKYIPLFLFIIDVVIINLSFFILFYCFGSFKLNSLKNFNRLIYLHYKALIFLNISWVIISIFSTIYKIHRYTGYVTIFNKVLKQIVLFSLVAVPLISGVGTLKENVLFNYKITLFYAILISVFTFFFRSLFVYLLQVYRKKGGNYRNVAIIGYSDYAEKLKDFFNKNPKYGYQFLGYFSNNDIENKLGEKLDYLNYDCSELDEIYCSIDSFNSKEVRKIITHSDQEYVKIKFIPDKDAFLTTKLGVEYYGFLPVLSFRELKLDQSFFRTLKRIFDIVFSSCVIIFLLSWLIPIISVLIRIESKGPVFFKQKRVGLKGERFWCYKFRSMAANNDDEARQATKNDMRITKMGAFMRKTSIDELPQFFNVLKGDMSVVGPRPHMISHDHDFIDDDKRYIIRHLVKPGITGLAQVKGYRGEIITKSDIKNRTRMDVFYVENWSFLMDLKIILDTVLNIFRGEEKAY